MAGHSQFKNIMHRKGRQDAMKSKLFGKLAREITVAAKLGTPDPAKPENSIVNGLGFMWNPEVPPRLKGKLRGLPRISSRHLGSRSCHPLLSSVGLSFCP